MLRTCLVGTLAEEGLGSEERGETRREGDESG